MKRLSFLIDWHVVTRKRIRQNYVENISEGEGERCDNIRTTTAAATCTNNKTITNYVTGAGIVEALLNSQNVNTS